MRCVSIEREEFDIGRLLVSEPRCLDARTFAEVVEIAIEAAVDVTETFDYRKRTKEGGISCFSRRNAIESREKHTAIDSSSTWKLRAIDSSEN